MVLWRGVVDTEQKMDSCLGGGLIIIASRSRAYTKDTQKSAYDPLKVFDMRSTNAEHGLMKPSSN